MILTECELAEIESAIECMSNWYYEANTLKLEILDYYVALLNKSYRNACMNEILNNE